MLKDCEMWDIGHWVRITLFIILGVFMLGFAEPYFELEAWQRIGFGVLLLLYAAWRSWQVYKSKKHIQ